jgi:hypothetical protein
MKGPKIIEAEGPILAKVKCTSFSFLALTNIIKFVTLSPGADRAIKFEIAKRQ